MCPQAVCCPLMLFIRDFDKMLVMVLTYLISHFRPLLKWVHFWVCQGIIELWFKPKNKPIHRACPNTLCMNDMSTSLHLSCIVTNVIHLPLCIASRRRNRRLAFYLIQNLQRRIGIFAQSIELFLNYVCNLHFRNFKQVNLHFELENNEKGSIFSGKTEQGKCWLTNEYLFFLFFIGQKM